MSEDSLKLTLARSIALLKRRSDFYAASHPTPADVLLVIEVADTSVEFDRKTEIPLYAGAEIPEALLANLPDDAIECFSQPVNGKYQSVKVLKRGEGFASQAVLSLTLNVDAILQ